MRGWKWFIPPWLAVAGLLGCGGCDSRPEESDDRGAGEPHRFPPEDTLPLPENVFGYAGEIDIHSRYPSTVVVRTYEPQVTGLVLTAGHCVCMKQPALGAADEGTLVIDRSTCATAPIVTTIDYDPPLEDGIKIEPGFRSRSYKAMEVRPHPEFKVLLDQQGRVLSSIADLAVIVLRQPIEGPFPIIPIADFDARAGELLTTEGSVRRQRLRAHISTGTG